MAENSDFYKELLENLYDGVYFVDQDRRITYWNLGAENITGYSSKQVVGRHCRDNVLNHVLANGTLLCTEHCPMAATIKDGKRREAEVFLHHSDGHRLPVLVRASPIYGENGEIIGAVETFSDNTSQIMTRRKNEQLKKSVFSDPLTNIGNSRMVEMRLASELLLFKESSIPFGILFLDVDHFKTVNDNFGHAQGDKVLKMVATTLKHNLREIDTLGRWGGEEFIILLNDTSADDLLVIANKLRFLISQSRLDGEKGPISVTVSIGASIIRNDDTAETLLQRADTLMYQSKMNGRDQVTAG